MAGFRRFSSLVTSAPRPWCLAGLSAFVVGTCPLALPASAQGANDPPPDPLQEFDLYEGIEKIDDHTFLKKVAPVAPALSARRGAYLGTELAEAAVPVGQVVLITGLGVTVASFVVGSLGRSTLVGPDLASDLLATGGVLQAGGLVAAAAGGGLWLGATGLRAAIAPRERPFYLLEAERAASKYNILYPWATPLRVRRLEAIRPQSPEAIPPPGPAPRPPEISAEPTAYLGTETARVLADGVWLASVGTPAGAYPLRLARGFGGYGEGDLGLGVSLTSSGRSLGQVGGAWKHLLLSAGGSQLALRAGLGLTGLGDSLPPTVGTELALPMSFALGPVVLTTTPQVRLSDLSAAGLGLRLGGNLGLAGRVGGGWSLLADVSPQVGLSGGFDAPASVGLRYAPSSQACLDLTFGRVGLWPEPRGVAGTVGLAGHVRL